MRNFIFTLIIIVPFILFSFYFAINYYTDISGKRDLHLGGNYYVVFVIDGDTIIVEKDGDRKLIRLIGVDAPEIRSEHNKRDECFGQESKKFLRDKIQGKYVRTEKDASISEKDRYGRILRYIFLGETFINKELIKNGYAYAYAIYEEHQFLDDFLYLEKEVQKNNLGLWKACY